MRKNSVRFMIQSFFEKNLKNIDGKRVPVNLFEIQENLKGTSLGSIGSALNLMKATGDVAHHFKAEYYYIDRINDPRLVPLDATCNGRTHNLYGKKSLRKYPAWPYVREDKGARLYRRALGNPDFHTTPRPFEFFIEENPDIHRDTLRQALNSLSIAGHFGLYFDQKTLQITFKVVPRPRKDKKTQPDELQTDGSMQPMGRSYEDLLNIAFKFKNLIDEKTEEAREKDEEISRLKAEVAAYVEECEKAYKRCEKLQAILNGQAKGGNVPQEKIDEIFQFGSLIN